MPKELALKQPAPTSPLPPVTKSSAAALASTSEVREALSFFARERTSINELHLQLCRIPAPTFLEAKRAEWMVAQFRSFGWDARVDRGGNVVALWDPGAKGPFVAATAHLDTVLAPRHPEEIRVDDDGTFRGPGVADNGAGLSALLALARCLREQPLRSVALSGLMLVANVGEEGEGNLSGMRYLCQQSSFAHRIRSFVVLDGPATDHITAHALASKRFEVTLSGPGGHSWSDFGAANPLHALSRAVTLFLEHPAAQRDGSPRSSFNFGIIEGGSSINAIPAEARAKVDIRSESMLRIEELVSALTDTVESAVQHENQRALTGKVVARLREIGFRPGGRTTDDSAVLQSIRAVDSLLGIRSHVDCASTDANIPLSMKLPAVSIGAGGLGGGAHTASEWFRPEGRDLGLRRILLALLLLLQR